MAGKCNGWHKTAYNASLRAFLQEREAYCVSACARIMKRNWLLDDMWAFYERGAIAALFFHSQRSLFPIFDRHENLSVPLFMEHFVRRTAIHASQGLGVDVDILQNFMGCFGIQPRQIIDYDLMTLDGMPTMPNAVQPWLILRRPVAEDMDRLYRLQAAYEQEEVLPLGVEFSPAACRQTLEHIVTHEKIIIACIGSRIVGKINTTAASFSRYQIGGVFVHPDYRHQGIASRMAAVFSQVLCAEGKELTLFVKKRNAIARTVYERIGFRAMDDYRINYY
ncbi:MAG: GNAT family N-acetyltransferase [Treponema sp.]|jgi:ribosomal protein S18 acetylase RimI-like enzyme|nr:GNAT family N-acetyltransferase [Treponema sp.]